MIAPASRYQIPISYILVHILIVLIKKEGEARPKAELRELLVEGGGGTVYR